MELRGNNSLIKKIISGLAKKFAYTRLPERHIQSTIIKDFFTAESAGNAEKGVLPASVLGIAMRRHV